MRKIESIREIQMIEYGMLCQLVDYLQEHDLPYALCGGTLLGAIRHGGFIPWDDDIDVYMLRKDYDRFMALVAAGQCQLGQLRIKLPGDPGTLHPFVKIFDPSVVIRTPGYNKDYPEYLWIDIFPMDHFPDAAWQHRICFAVVTFMRRTLLLHTFPDKVYGQTPIKRATWKFFKMVLGDPRRLTRAIDDYARRTDARFAGSDHYSDGPWPENMKDYFESRMIMPTVKHVFEDRQFDVPVNYDAYLRQFYGDYMTPPPVDQRAKHEFTAYRIDED